MKPLKDVLQPLSSATNVLSSSKHATVSLVLPLKVKIVKKCRPSTDDDTFIKSSFSVIQQIIGAVRFMPCW